MLPFLRFRSLLVCGVATALVATAVACAQNADDASAGAQDLSSDGEQAPAATPSVGEQTVRAYYAATQGTDAEAKLTPIVADNAILAAPSIKLLTGKTQLEGKDAFIKGVAGNASVLGKATLREVIRKDDTLVVSRIDLPLPNGDTITQVEFFTLEGGKIARLDSYYDSIRFAAAIPSILLDRLKAQLSGL